MSVDTVSSPPSPSAFFTSVRISTGKSRMSSRENTAFSISLAAASGNPSPSFGHTSSQHETAARIGLNDGFGERQQRHRAALVVRRILSRQLGGRSEEHTSE